MTHLLEARQLSVSAGGRQICQELDLVLQPGEVWAILGPNGAGKTTLLHTLAGLCEPAQGCITLHGSSFQDLDRRELARSIGVLFQDFHCGLPQTVREYCLGGRYPHLGLGKKISLQDQQIASAAIHAMALEPLLDRQLGTLSGGEQRRAAIAALLTQTPAIFLLDEPGNHLDMRSQMTVLRHFHYLSRTAGAAILMSLHDINLVQQFCDNVLLLFPDGGILQGSRADILQTENLSRLYQHPVEAIHHDGKLFWHPRYTESEL